MSNWTFVPRVLAISYMGIMCNIVLWFESISQQFTTKINVDVLNALLSHNVSPVLAVHLASSSIKISDGPSTVQSILITAFCGVAAVVFGFYLRTEYIVAQAGTGNTTIQYPQSSPDGPGSGLPPPPPPPGP